MRSFAFIVGIVGVSFIVKALIALNSELMAWLDAWPQRNFKKNRNVLNFPHKSSAERQFRLHL